LTFEPSDASLAARFRDAEDHQAFETLVLRHVSALRRFLAVHLPGDEEGAADAEQEVLIRLHTALGRWRGMGEFTTFLFVLAQRVAIDEVRRRMRERRRTERFGRWTRPGQELREADADPQGAWIACEEGLELRRALETLPEPDRSILYLKDGEGRDIEALCQIFGLKEGTVKSKLSRARARLRTILKEENHA